MRVRALFAKMEDEGVPILVAAMDQTIWEHLDEDPWIETRNEWPDEYEWREAWIEIGDDAGLLLFPETPEIVANIEAATSGAESPRDEAVRAADVPDMAKDGANPAAVSLSAPGAAVPEPDGVLPAGQRHPNDEPTDDDLYNGYGREGGIAYDTDVEPGSLGEHDWRL